MREAAKIYSAGIGGSSEVRRSGCEKPSAKAEREPRLAHCSSILIPDGLPPECGDRGPEPRTGISR
jgi:hypothetical protein